MNRAVFIFLLLLNFCASGQENIYIRINQAGYLPHGPKTAIIFSKKPVSQKINLINGKDLERVKSLKPVAVTHGGWGNFEYYYEIDFSFLKTEGNYFLETEKSKERSAVFPVSKTAYKTYPASLLGFMRQQRCGYNPTLDVFCHQKDGYSFYGPMKDTTFVDATGGWHDAGDQLKYLITGSYATAHLLKTYELYPEQFDDKYDSMGRPGSNGVPDILDEAKWGLDWIHKLHPQPNALIHQIADDRDHAGFKMPDKDNSDYGWGQNSYRPAYFVTGKPQGLGNFLSEATGVSNVAGRSAAAMAIAARIWIQYDKDYAGKCREAAQSLYQMAIKNEGFQQGNSVKAPYRYNERTFNDDLEWAAAEMFKLFKKPEYLDQAKKYALKSNTADSWTVKDSASHYELYPFLNMGHFVLHELVDKDFQLKLEGFYLDGIQYTQKRANQNPFKIGVPFIWCSNNLLTSLAAQIILYQKMTGTKAYEDFLAAQRDWLFGRNPWGVSMFTGIPEGGKYPKEVHTSLYILGGYEIPGGLVDGPVYSSIYNNLLGIRLEKPDPFASVQNNFVVYHDDIGDYSTNEPTMDGTAGSMLLMAHLARKMK